MCMVYQALGHDKDSWILESHFVFPVHIKVSRTISCNNDRIDFKVVFISLTLINIYSIYLHLFISLLHC